MAPSMGASPCNAVLHLPPLSRHDRPGEPSSRPAAAPEPQQARPSARRPAKQYRSETQRQTVDGASRVLSSPRPILYSHHNNVAQRSGIHQHNDSSHNSTYGDNPETPVHYGHRSIYSGL